MISIQKDLDALRLRFFSAFSTSDPQVLWLGKPTTNPDESKPYCRYVVEPGERAKVEQGATTSWLQLGLVTLTVTVPKGVGLAIGYDMRDRFAGLFNNWVSADRALVIGSSSDSLTETDTHIHLRIRFRWESFRSE